MTLDPQSISDSLGALLKYQDDIAKLQGSEATRILDEARQDLTGRSTEAKGRT